MGLITSSAMILVEPPTRLSYTIPGDPVPSQPGQPSSTGRSSARGGSGNAATGSASSYTHD